MNGKLPENVEKAARNWCKAIGLDFDALGPIGRQRVLDDIGEQPDAGSGGDALETALEIFKRRKSDIPYEVYQQIEVVCSLIAARQPVGGAGRIPSDMVDGKLSVAEAIDRVVELSPSADRAALRRLAACLTHHSIHRYTAPPAPAAVPVDGWIDISERKPERPQEVLFVLDGRTVAGAWIGDIFCYNNKKRAALWWQPFPEPRIGAATHPQPAAAGGDA